MKSVILILLLLGGAIKCSYAQLTLYPNESSMFSLDSDIGDSKTIRPSTTLSGFPIFRLNRELKFVEVEQ